MQWEFELIQFSFAMIQTRDATELKRIFRLHNASVSINQRIRRRCCHPARRTASLNNSIRSQVCDTRVPESPLCNTHSVRPTQWTFDLGCQGSFETRVNSNLRMRSFSFCVHFGCKNVCKCRVNSAKYVLPQLLHFAE